MPEPITAAPAAAPSVVPAASKMPSAASKVGSVTPQSSGVIQVTPTAIDHFDDTSPGTPKGDLFSRMEKLAEKGPDKTPTAKKDAKAAPAKSEPAAKAEPAAKSAPELSKAEPAAEPTPEEVKAKAAEKPANGKVNPWKLYERAKSENAALEAKLAETRKLIKDEAAAKSELERIKKIEARAKELEDHIRYVDYSKSQEFQEKYQKPYEKAWSNALSELKEITVADANGGERPFSAQDMLELVNLPLSKARELANEVFGDMADDVMAQRKEIRALFDRQTAALEEARASGAEREKTARAELERTHGEIGKQVSETWKSLNEAIVKDEKIGKYFQTIDGDDEANSRLQKGYELVDSAFSQNPMDPKLKPEERAEIIKKHVAVRNRAAAFGRLTHLLSKSEARIAELEAELSQYSESTPDIAGRKTTPTASGEPGGMEGMFSRLEKMAK